MILQSVNNAPSKSRKYWLISLDKVLDFVVNFAIAYVLYFFYKTVYPGIDHIKSLFVIGLLCFVAIFLYNYYNVYSPMRTKSPLFFVTRIFLVHCELFAVTLMGLYLIVPEENLSWYTSWLLSAMFFSTLIITAKKIFMITVLYTLRVNKKSIKHILLVTDSQEMADTYMEEILNNPHFGYSVIGYVGNLNVIGLPHLGTTGNLDRILKEYHPDEVVMAFDNVRKKVITKYINICNNNCAKVLFVPSICGYFKSPRQVNVVGNLPLIDIRSTPLDNFGNQLCKRILDIIGSLILIVLTSPLMLFTAIGVKLSSPGPILFRQIRVGRNNKEFTMYKFRSMRVNDSEQTGWSTENDPRKTRFGAFIRKCALDELPQFFNVLKGDMSLVGPRPEVPFYVEKFKKEIPLYMLKHTLRPGITGLAQIKGLRGDTSIQARINEDINYIENWTLLGDIRILLLTPLHAINRHEKYAKREQLEEQKNATRANWKPSTEVFENDDEE